MSEKKKVAKAPENEKVMTKYDVKTQKRKEAAARAKKEERTGIIVGVVLILALIALIASFPIRSYLVNNKAFITVGGEKVTRAEFAYQYNVSKQDFITQMGSYLELFGITDTTTMDSQMYSDQMTFGDYFSQMAAQLIAGNKGIMKQAKAEGFEYDASKEVAELKSTLETQAMSYSMTLDDYLAAQYGELATWERLEPCFEEEFIVNAYYEKIIEDCQPTDDEIMAEYEGNTMYYDCVDYRMTIFDAELQTTTTDKDGNEVAYTPTEDEIAAAMKDAKKEADAAVKTIAKEGTEYLQGRYTGMVTVLGEYLYDESRKAGDTVVLEDTDNNRYLAVAFEKRYLNDEPTHNFRMIATEEGGAAAILKDWEAGDGTEKSFIKLVQMHDLAGAVNDGLQSCVPVSTFKGTQLADWLSEEREAGDVFGATLDDGYDYVVYYVGTDLPAWKNEIKSLLIYSETTMIMQNITNSVEIEDPDGHLVYLTLEAQTAETEATESAAE